MSLQCCIDRLSHRFFQRTNQFVSMMLRTLFHYWSMSVERRCPLITGWNSSDSWRCQKAPSLKSWPLGMCWRALIRSLLMLMPWRLVNQLSCLNGRCMCACSPALDRMRPPWLGNPCSLNMNPETRLKDYLSLQLSFTNPWSSHAIDIVSRSWNLVTVRAFKLVTKQGWSTLSSEDAAWSSCRLLATFNK